MEYINIGKVVNTHGIKGEIKIYPYTNDIQNLSLKKKFYIDEKSYKVKRASVFKNMLIVKFEGINTIDETKSIMNKELYIEKQPIVEEDVYYVEDLIGLEVYKTYEDNVDYDSYEYLGKLEYVYTGIANDVYEVVNV